MRKNKLTAALAAVIALCGACGNQDDAGVKPPAAAPAAAQPVTLKVFNGLFNEQDWQTIVVEPLKRKFPNMTLEPLTGKIEDLVTAGQVPDLVLNPVSSIANLMALDLPLDMTELMKKHNVTLNGVDGATVDALKKWSFGQGTLALPIYINFQVAVYNKDIFDKFGVPYPRNHTTYDEMITVSRQLTKQDNGVTYKGYNPGHWTENGGQLSLAIIDPRTNAAVLDGYKPVFELHKRIADMMPDGLLAAKNDFYKTRSLAMTNDWLESIARNAPQLAEFKWGMVTIPEFKEKPGLHSETDFHAAFIAKTSSHKDEAMLVIGELIHSEDIQTLITRTGKMTILTNPAIRKQWGAGFGLENNAEAAQAIAETKMAPVRDIHPLDRRKDIVITPVGNEYAAYLKGAKDVNTALRDAKEAVDKQMQAELKR